MAKGDREIEAAEGVGSRALFCFDTVKRHQGTRYDFENDRETLKMQDRGDKCSSSILQWSTRGLHGVHRWRDTLCNEGQRRGGRQRTCLQT